MKYQKVNSKLLGFLTVFALIFLSNACDQLFEGFGIFLGSPDHFATSQSVVIPRVFEKVYDDLRIRHFRTSYDPTFSLERDSYAINCTTPRICSWIAIHDEIKNYTKYSDTSFIASIWSPPSYQKDNLTNTLVESEELNYYYYIKNITALIKTQFNITIENVSPINEPENVFAQWDHTNMGPLQLCRMVRNFNDPLISICPENAYYSTSLVYSSIINFPLLSSLIPPCMQTCQVFGTHAYALTATDSSLKAYYDLVPQSRSVPSTKSIWMTEVSSTFADAATTQMTECLDMSTNIVNYLGRTCIQRYYYWYAYTLGSSGESLLWGNADGTLTFPKKYYCFKHFTLAAFGGSKKINKYNPAIKVSYLTFGNSTVVFVNKGSTNVGINSVNCLAGTFCCSTNQNDWDCTGNGTFLPSKSVCSCST